MKKIISTILILVIFVQNPVFVLAQEASSSASPILENPTESPTFPPSPTPTQTIPNSLLEDEDNNQTTIRTEDQLDNLSGQIIFDKQKTGPQNSSARFRTAPRIKKLSKKNYKIDEKITVTVENTITENTKITLLNAKNEEVPIQSEIVHDIDPTIIKLRPPRNFRPGKYSLKITDPDGQESTQNFTWGVLAINTNKSIYSPQETANLAIAVLDEMGMMVCDAKLELSIYNPDGVKTILTTENGEIKVNPECFMHDFTTNPDYETEYQTGDPGKYSLTLTAQTKNGSYTIDDAFEVRQDLPFDIERESATRIYPPKTYPVKITINANQNFKGEIREIVPSTFLINPLAGTTPYKDIKVIEGSQVNTATTEAGFSLLPPFSGEHQMTNDFGVEVEDPLLKSLYQNSGLKGHDGLDYALPEGTPIYSVDEGLVYFTGDQPYGNTVMIQHSWGKSYYGHLSEILVEQGQTVLPGDRIGLSGSTGLSTGPHLHFGIKLNRNEVDNGYYGKINPLPYLNYSSFVTDPDTVQIITWEVDIKAGDKLEIGYQFKAPNESPELYLLGPLQLRNNDQIIHQELRQWQIAADADVLIDDSVASTANRHQARPHIVFTTDQIGYSFFTDGGPSCAYTKTTDGGASWNATEVDLASGLADCRSIAVWYDRWTPGDTTGNYIHMVLVNNVTHDFYYERIDTANSDTQLGEVAIDTSSTSLTSTDPSTITKATDGVLYAGISDDTTAGTSKILKCSSSCGTGGNWTAVGTSPLDLDNDPIRLMPMSSGNVMLIRWDVTADDIEWRYWDGSDWDNPSAGWSDITTDAVDLAGFNNAMGVSLLLSTGDIYLAYVASVGGAGTADVRTTLFNGSSWSNGGNVQTDQSSIYTTDIFVDQNNGDAYVAWIEGGSQTTKDIYASISTDDMANWSTLNGGSALNTDNVNTDNEHVQLNMISDERVYFEYMNEGTEDIKGGTIADLTPDTGPTNDQLLKHGGWVSGGVDNPFTF